MPSPKQRTKAKPKRDLALIRALEDRYRRCQHMTAEEWIAHHDKLLKRGLALERKLRESQNAEKALPAARRKSAAAGRNK